MKQIIKIFGLPETVQLLKYHNQNNIIRNNFQIIYDNDIRECDVLVVFAEGGWNNIRFNTNAKQRICFTGEPACIYNYSTDFLNQFTDIVTSQDVIVKNNIRVHKNQQCLNYFVGFNRSTLEFNEQIANQTFNNTIKTKLLSVVASNKCITPQHRKRIEFLTRLKVDIPELDIYGTMSGKMLDYKDYALQDYKYSIAIENCSIDDYWTEKIADCIYSLTDPIYCGCTNISKYFNGITVIDINDYDSALSIIRTKIYGDSYNQAELIARRDKLLAEYSFHNTIFSLIT